MENPDSETLRQIRELRAEVQSLRRTIVYVAIGFAVVVFSKTPDDLVTVVIVGVVLALLFERKNFTMFPSKGHDSKSDA